LMTVCESLLIIQKSERQRWKRRPDSKGQWITTPPRFLIR
jgi:hypothetical protein